MHGTLVYAADRWLYNDVTSHVQYANGGLSYAVGYVIYQRCETALNDGAVRTLAIGTTDGSRYCTVLGGEYVLMGASGYRCTHNNESVVYIERTNAEALPLAWAWLMPGEYTDDTLPEYVPPDPDVELVKCQRYYENSWYPYSKNWANEMFAAAYSADLADGRIAYKVTKRLLPTVNFFPDTSYADWMIFLSGYKTIKSVSYLNRGAATALLFRLERDADANTTPWVVGQTMQVRGHWEAIADL